MNSQSTVNESEVWPPISKDNWIKVMVVADGPMLKYHGKKLERYILTLMQTVNSIVFDNTLCVLKIQRF